MARLLERLRATTELLASIAADRSVLAGVPAQDRRRLLEAVALVYSPDRAERRRMAKITARERKAARVKQDEAVLAATGIRTLRRRPVFRTPNVFPPERFAPDEVDDDPDGNGVELYWDRPKQLWPKNGNGALDMFTKALDLEDLLNEMDEI